MAKLSVSSVIFARKYINFSYWPSQDIISSLKFNPYLFFECFLGIQISADTKQFLVESFSKGDERWRILRISKEEWHQRLSNLPVVQSRNRFSEVIARMQSRSISSCRNKASLSYLTKKTLMFMFLINICTQLSNQITNHTYLYFKITNIYQCSSSCIGEKIFN